MYDIIKSVIDSKRYELADILAKIDTIWIQRDITESQKTELVELARTNADPKQSYAPLQEQIDNAFAQIKTLERRVAVLETGGSTDPTSEPDEWPEWVQPTGAHDAYNTGDKVTYNSKHYESIIDRNVWSPDTYPAGWQEVTE